MGNTAICSLPTCCATRTPNHCVSLFMASQIIRTLTTAQKYLVPEIVPKMRRTRPNPRSPGSAAFRYLDHHCVLGDTLHVDHQNSAHMMEFNKQERRSLCMQSRSHKGHKGMNGGVSLAKVLTGGTHH